MEDLRGRVAVVTGAASGIGLALTERFLDEGMRVVLADCNEPRLREVEARLHEDGADVRAAVCDTGSGEDIHALAAAVLDWYGATHVLCNNAGIAGMGDAWRGPISVWERTIAINLLGVVHGIRAFLPMMEDQGEGHIVNTASMAGLVALPGAAPYNVTKHGVVAVSEGLFLELKATASPIGVSVLCPGFVRTRLMEAEPAGFGSPMPDIINEMLRAGIETGIEPSVVAAEVIDAIRTDRFWILTHADMREEPVERMRRAADQQNPG